MCFEVTPPTPSKALKICKRDRAFNNNITYTYTFFNMLQEECLHRLAIICQNNI